MQVHCFSAAANCFSSIGLVFFTIICHYNSLSERLCIVHCSYSLSLEYRVSQEEAMSVDKCYRLFLLLENHVAFVNRQFRYNVIAKYIHQLYVSLAFGFLIFDPKFHLYSLIENSWVKW